MKLDWERIKDKAKRWFEIFAAFFLFQNFVGYLVACVAAGHPLGVGGYVRFLGHLFQWAG
jgi:hypothetical protein